MRNIRFAVVAILVCSTLTACSSNPPAPATITLVAPGGGSILGDTALTITGTGFSAGSLVTIDGVAATAIVAVNGTTITCATPAGASTGAKDVTVTSAGGADTAVAAFTYFPPPSLTSVSAARTSAAGGHTIRLTGTGFAANGATGTNTVTIGGMPATGIVEIADTALSCVTPPGAEGAVDVVITNANGMSTLVGGLTYVTPMLYAATARSSAVNQPGVLYTINPATGAGTMVGATGDVLTGLAFDPTFTTLYGLNTGPFSDQSVFTVNVTTGATTLVGPSGTPPKNNCGDITFVGTTLVGNSWDGEFCSFNTATGAGTLIGTNPASQSLAIAADSDQTIYILYGSSPGELCTVNPATGALTLVGIPFGDIGTDTICAMTFLDGVLYGVTAGNQSSVAAARLVTINPTTAAVTTVGNLPDFIDALEGNLR